MSQQDQVSPAESGAVQEIRQRWKRASDEPMTRIRYDHGGGRMFIDGGGRHLVVDCYDEDNREFYFAAQGDVAILLAEVSRLSAQLTEAQREREDLRDTLHRHGYRRCDIAACNCNGWHGGHASARLDEIDNALQAADIDTNGKTLLGAVGGVLQQLTEAQQQIAQMREKMLGLAAMWRRQASIRQTRDPFTEAAIELETAIKITMNGAI